MNPLEKINSYPLPFAALMGVCFSEVAETKRAHAERRASVVQNSVQSFCPSMAAVASASGRRALETRRGAASIPAPHLPRRGAAKHSAQIKRKSSMRQLLPS